MNNFKEYGFEADFEGEILKEIEDMSAEKLFIGYIVYDCKVHSCMWQHDGVVVSRGINQLTFNLTPIKKEWYEKEDTFRIAVRQIKSLIDFSPVFGQIQIMQKTTDNKGMSQYITDGHHTPVEWLKCYQPATKEEVLSLLVKD